jgi:hypothetical protein
MILRPGGRRRGKQAKQGGACETRAKNGEAEGHRVVLGSVPETVLVGGGSSQIWESLETALGRFDDIQECSLKADAKTTNEIT